MEEPLRENIAGREGCLTKKQELTAKVPMLREAFEQKQGRLLDLLDKRVRISETFK